MGDLQPFHRPLFDRFIALSRQPSNARYQQLMAVGGDRFTLEIANSCIKNMRAASDLAVNLTVAEKKSKSWMTATSVEPGFSMLSDWNRAFDLIAKKAVSSQDPRPPFNEADLPEEFEPLRRYDPDIASLLPAVVFHRIFQSFGKFIEQGFLIDADCAYTNGFYSPKNSPLCFAFVDDTHFCFQPQTTLFESVCIRHRDNPALRRYAHQTSSKLDDFMRLDSLAAELQNVDTSRLIAFNPMAFDDIILMPGAASQLAQYLLRPFDIAPETTTLPDKSQKCLSESLELACDPSDPCFGRDCAFDVHGIKTAPIRLISNGLPDTIPTGGAIAKKHHLPNNGHATANGHAEPFCPVLKSAQDVDLPTFSSTAQFTAGSNRLVLCIEHLQLFALDDSTTAVQFSSGGVLCQNGRCCAHVAPPDKPFVLQPLLDSARPASAPTRIGALASCALKLDPAAFKTP